MTSHLTEEWVVIRSVGVYGHFREETEAKEGEKIKDNKRSLYKRRILVILFRNTWIFRQA